MEKIISIVCFIVPIAISGFFLYCWWLIYEKMDEKGWKCLVPFYGRYLLFKNVWEGKVYFISLLIGIAGFALDSFASLEIIRILAGADTTGATVMIFAGIFSFISFCLQMMLNWRMIKCFGMGFMCFLGITFLPIVFIPVLAIGRASYDYY